MQFIHLWSSTLYHSFFAIEVFVGMAVMPFSCRRCFSCTNLRLTSNKLHTLALHFFILRLKMVQLIQAFTARASLSRRKPHMHDILGRVTECYRWSNLGSRQRKEAFALRIFKRSIILLWQYLGNVLLTSTYSSNKGFSYSPSQAKPGHLLAVRVVVYCVIFHRLAYWFL